MLFIMNYYNNRRGTGDRIREFDDHLILRSAKRIISSFLIFGIKFFLLPLYYYRKIYNQTYNRIMFFVYSVRGNRTTVCALNLNRGVTIIVSRVRGGNGNKLPPDVVLASLTRNRDLGFSIFMEEPRDRTSSDAPSLKLLQHKYLSRNYLF